MTTKPTTIILSGFSLVILLVLSLLVITLYQLNLTKQTVNNIILLRAEHAAIASNLQDISHSRSGIIANLLFIEDAFTKDDMVQNLYQLGEQFMLKRAILLDSSLDDFERTLLEKHMETSQKIVSIQHQIVKLSLDNKQKKAHHLFMHSALPTQQKNSKLLDQLSQHENNEIQKNISSLDAHLNTTFILTLTAGAFIIIFCILVAIFIYKRLTRNISSLQNTRDELSQSLSDLKNIKHALDLHAIVSVTDTSGIITYVNEMFCEVSQYSEESLIGQKHNIINSGYHNKNIFRDMWTTIESGKEWRGEICNRKKDGSYYWVESTIVPFLDKNDLPYQYIAIRTEVTQLKNIEENLKFSLEQLVIESEKALESNTLKSSIISTMTHELRTPLNSILGYSQLLLLEKESLSDIQIDNIENITESGNELLNSIDDILLYSKLKSQTINIQKNNSDLYTILSAIINKHKFDSNAAFVLPEITSTISIEIYADLNLFQKALSYVIDNAIKFTKSGHIKISYQKIQKDSSLTDHHTTAKNDLILITIEDTGVGIPADKIQIIFDEFRQSDEKDSRKFEGFGIGLTLAKSIINLHGGEIWLTSEVDIGTKLHISIPDLM